MFLLPGLGREFFKRFINFVVSYGNFFPSTTACTWGEEFFHISSFFFPPPFRNPNLEKFREALRIYPWYWIGGERSSWNLFQSPRACILFLHISSFFLPISSLFLIFPSSHIVLYFLTFPPYFAIFLNFSFHISSFSLHTSSFFLHIFSYF